MLSMKLAWNNIKKSLNNFAPFLMTTTVMYTILFIVVALSDSPSLDKLASPGNSIAAFMTFALAILTIFTAIILIYSYRFLQLQRSREFGLYDILGFGKFKIIMVAGCELIYSYFLTVFLGTLVGSILAKFLFLIFVNLIGGNYFNLIISFNVISKTALIFFSFFLFLFIIGAFIINRQAGLTLINANKKGETEPQANRLLALIAIILLGVGYGLALSVLNPIEALLRFAIAIVLVILGTYFFYISFITWYLKWRKSLKSYYTNKNFIPISSMLYRMKQNALGLASITILLSMALVTIVVTASIFFGTNNFVSQQFPQSARATLQVPLKTPTSAVTQKINQAASHAHVDIKQVKTVEIVYGLTFDNQNSTNKIINADHTAKTLETYKTLTVNLITQTDFKKLGNHLPNLVENQVGVYDLQGNKGEQLKTINWFGQPFKVKYHITHLTDYPESINYTNTILIVLPNNQLLSQAHLAYNKIAYAHNKSDNTKTLISLFNIPAAKTDAYYQAFNHLIDHTDSFSGFVSFKHVLAKQMKAIIGGFLFIGFVLSISFILGAALIIYYKQLTEGLQDKRSYEILQELGLSKIEISKSIAVQLRFIFLLPIIIMIVHFCFAYKMIQSSLTLFSINDSSLIMTISILTIAIIFLLYWLIYKLTSKVYYKIIER
ncbi:ABC transporter permease and substrate binding protein [Weissella oryzae SG25]|uniref:ABC transporter permease and substrate binding protein n=1 Tax=Weissella oryzae (strain DSM 25784 / JCM 18191 / LMG 30913 / SG25) TaxID=1329250 RepID=A0A069CQZ0_WEIOS|nr:FtsX-like permease family protein [Weissella oryzae]GAK30135.1 ABC transporter permease and substrate binding protein [Weissella oryzae SG25]